MAYDTAYVPFNFVPKDGRNALKAAIPGRRPGPTT